jgi:hypothetical protein
MPSSIPSSNIPTRLPSSSMPTKRVRTKVTYSAIQV